MGHPASASPDPGSLFTAGDLTFSLGLIRLPGSRASLRNATTPTTRAPPSPPPTNGATGPPLAERRRGAGLRY